MKLQFFLRVPSVKKEVCNSKRLGCLWEFIDNRRTETASLVILTLDLSVKLTHQRMLLPHPAIDVEHAKSKLLNGETYVFPSPKEIQVFLATYGTARLRETRRRCRLDVYRLLHSYSWSRQVQPATCEYLSLGELHTLLSIYRSMEFKRT